MRRDWTLEARSLLTEACRHARGTTQYPRSACLECLAEALARVYEAGRADARSAGEER